MCYDVCEHIEGRRSCQLLEMEPRRVSRRLSRRRRQFDARSVRMLNATCLKLKRGRSSLTFVSIVARAGCCWLCGFPTLLAVLAVCPRPPAALRSRHQTTNSISQELPRNSAAARCACFLLRRSHVDAPARRGHTHGLVPDQERTQRVWDLCMHDEARSSVRGLLWGAMSQTLHPPPGGRG